MLISTAALAQVKDAGAQTKDAGTVVKLGDAIDAGLVKATSTYAQVGADGGTVYVSVVQLKDGGTASTMLDASPCRRRPKGTTAAKCLAKLADGGTRDPGAENVMQAGQWVDNGGCEQCACAVIFGKERFK